MIFVTVGAQMPFDRLVRAVDEWAGGTGRSDVLAQVGPSDYEPTSIRWERFMPPPRFRRVVEEASVLVAHAGTGSILTAMEMGKPILIMPRRGHLGETRNDHQLATARRFMGSQGIAVAFDEHELRGKLDTVDRLSAHHRISHYASSDLIDGIRSFLAR